jgi:hypothetical protein
VTVQEKPRFAQCFNRLAVALRLPADDGDAAMQRIYWDALADFPIDAVEDAAHEFARSATWFPKTSEWRSQAELARNTRALVASRPDADRDPWRYECQACDDSGFELLTCQAGARCPRPDCSRRDASFRHVYAVVCSCRETNRTYQRRRERMYALRAQVGAKEG